MNRKYFAVVFIYLCFVSAIRADRPNIVIIMSDDMGYSDIGCYGGEIDTPNLNSLADNGLRFTQFYNTGRCCPTRASLLTGLYPHQAGVGWMMTDSGYDGYRGDLNNQCRTIAEVLKPAGYRTYMSGKWHVTKQESAQSEKYNWPLQRGFEKFYGTISGAGSFWDPWSLVRQNTPISCAADPEYRPETYYYTHAITDHAVKFIQDHQKESDEEPFFLYVAYTAAHWPMHALTKDIEKYKGRFDAGFSQLRQERYQRMQKIGLLRSEWMLSSDAEQWDQVKHREWDLRNMEVYAAMVDSMDQGIGNIVAALEETGQLDNTLVMYLQDNGGCAEGLGRTARGGLSNREVAPTLPAMRPEALQTKMIPDQTRDGFPTLMGPGVMAGPDGTYIAYGRGWANVSNTPFREYKHWVHEGGIATPLIAHWPAGIKGKGTLTSQPGHLIDLMATCVDLAEADYPSKVNGHAIKPLEGKSLRPAFLKQKIQRDALYWEHEGNRAVREGDWKLVAKGPTGDWELYNLRKDRTEQTNLAATHPELTVRLAAKFDEYAKRANVYPLVPYRNNRPNLSNKTNFSLKHGDSLEQSKAPNVVDRDFVAEIVLSKGFQSGVIVSQGGTAHGWSIYLEEGQLRFSSRVRGKLTVVKTDRVLSESETRLKLDYQEDGKVQIFSGLDVILSGDVGSGMKEMPLDPLEVGGDTGGIVGPYSAGFESDGNVVSVKIVLMERK